MRYYPIFLDTSKMSVIVGGGGRAALIKIRELARTEAYITVISLEFCSEIKKLAAGNDNINLIQDDLTNITEYMNMHYDIGFLCTNNEALNAKIHIVLSADNTLILRADNKKASDFITGSIVQNGSITVGTSTGGLSPSMAVMISEEIKSMLDDILIEKTELMGMIREVIIKQYKESKGKEYINETMRKMAKKDNTELSNIYLRIKDNAHGEDI